MSLPSLSVRRPVTVAMGVLAIVVFGFLSAGKLPVELLPDLSYPTLTIQTLYPDAAPVSVEQFVTRPVEEAVGVIPGVRDLRSVSRSGLSEVILEFGWDEDMDFASLDVREKLGLVRLPRECDIPRVLRFDPSLDPVLRLGFTGDRPLDDLRRFAERWIKPRLESIPGAAAAKVRGGLIPEIQVEADEDRLAALGLTLDDLSRALVAENVNIPGGQLKDWGSVYLVRTLHEFENIEQVSKTVVREGPSGRVRVEDVATVLRGHRDRDEITRVQGIEAIEIAVHREGSANTVAVARDVREELARIEEELSPGLALSVLDDQSLYIADAVGQVWSAGILGGILAILVLFFFLRDPAATAIIAITIPVSVVATFLPLRQAGVSLNIMSLGGLALGVGMLVDNSIVVLEAIDRRRRQGRSRREAAILGATDVAGAVTAATLTTVAVFFPIVFVVGVAGQLFYDLAVTVCLSLLFSLVVSLTLIPSLSGLEIGKGGPAPTLFRWDRRREDGSDPGDPPLTLRIGPATLLPVGDGVHLMSKILTAIFFLPRLAVLVVVLAVVVLFSLFSRIFHGLTTPLARAMDALGQIYPRLLHSALRWRFLVLPLTFGLLALLVPFALSRLGTNLVPDLAQGRFAFRLRLPEGTALLATSQIVERIEEPLLKTSLFGTLFSVTGSLPSTASGRQTIGENLAQIDFVLPPGSTAEKEEAAVKSVRKVLSLYPRVEAELIHPSVLSLRPPVEIKIFGEDLAELDRAAEIVFTKLARTEGILDVSSTSEPGNPEVTVELDRERAATLGVQAESIARSLRRQIRGEIVGQFREEEERIDIRLRASEADRNRASRVEALRVRLPGGTAIPISAVAKVNVGTGPAAIHRAGGARVARIAGQVSAADLGLVLSRTEESLGSLALPAGVTAELGGQDEDIGESFRSLRLAMLLAIFLVYVVMAMQFESIIHPFVILLSVPLGAIGVLVALLVTGTPVSVLVLIGAVMLAGIVVNNAIVLVDAVNRRRRSGEALTSAIVEAGMERLRPILMTTATTVLALLPMALGLGAGDELRRPLAITVIGGLTAATLLTLVLVPCLVRIMTRRGEGEAGPGVVPAELPSPGERLSPQETRP